MKYLLIALLTASLSSVSLANHHKDKEMEYDGEARMEKMSKKLDLDENQAAAMKELNEKYSADMKALREQHRKDMSNILNDEQMKKFMEMKEKRHNSMD